MKEEIYKCDICMEVFDKDSLFKFAITSTSIEITNYAIPHVCAGCSAQMMTHLKKEAGDYLEESVSLNQLGRSD